MAAATATPMSCFSRALNAVSPSWNVLKSLQAASSA